MARRANDDADASPSCLRTWSSLSRENLQDICEKEELKKNRESQVLYQMLLCLVVLREDVMSTQVHEGAPAVALSSCHSVV